MLKKLNNTQHNGRTFKSGSLMRLLGYNCLSFFAFIYKTCEIEKWLFSRFAMFCFIFKYEKHILNAIFSAIFYNGLWHGQCQLLGGGLGCVPECRLHWIPRLRLHQESLWSEVHIWGQNLAKMIIIYGIRKF